MKTIQYTIRNVPEDISNKLRQTARKGQRSINKAALDSLARGLGVSDEPVIFHDLDDLAGTWVKDPAFDAAVAVFIRPDPEMWK